MAGADVDSITELSARDRVAVGGAIDSGIRRRVFVSSSRPRHCLRSRRQQRVPFLAELEVPASGVSATLLPPLAQVAPVAPVAPSHPGTLAPLHLGTPWRSRTLGTLGTPAVSQ